MANFLEILPPYQMLKGLASSLSAKKLRAEVDKEEESIRRRRSELLSLAEKETDISKKKVYLEEAMNIKNYSLESLNKVLADAPTTKQILASAGETVLMMTGGSALRLLKSGYKGVQSFKGAFKIGRFGSSENRAAMAVDKLNQLITKSQKLEKFQKASTIGKTLQVGKSIASSTAEGAAFGTLAEISINKDATTESILQSAGTTAVLGGGLNVLGRGLGVGMKAYGEKVSPKVKELYKTIKTKIDDYAQGKELSKTSYDKVASSMDLNKSISRNIAKKTINFLDYSEKGVAKFFDRFDPIKIMEDAIYEAKGKPLTKQERVYVQTRLLNGRVDAKTNEELNKISKEVDAIFKGDSQLKKDSSVYLKALDDVDRARNGQLLEVVDGKSVSVSEEQAVKRLEDIYGDFVATNKIDLLESARNIYNRETNLELEKLRKSGILDDAQIAAMKEAHPNFIPHNVIFDKIEKSYIKSSLNVSESGIKKAFGSIRKIEDPWEAMAARRLLINRKVAQNNLMKSLTKNGETYGLDGFRPLQTSKSVKLKNTFIEELKKLKTLKEDLKRQYKRLNKEDRRILSKINKLEDDINKLNKDALNSFLKQETPEEAKKLITQLKIKTTPTIVKDGGVGVRGGKAKTKIIESGSYNEVKITAKNTKELRDVLSSAKIKKSDIENILKNIKKGEYKTGSIILSQKNVGGKTKDYVENLIDNLRGLKNKELEGIKSKISITEKRLSKAEELKYLGEKEIDKTINDLIFLNKELKDKWIKIQSLSAKKPKSGETTINLFNDGIKETWVVPEDIAIAVKGTDVIPPTGILKALSTVNKIFKQLTTQLNPEFAIPNFARDRQTMMLTADSIIQEMATRTKVTPKEVNLSSKELQELLFKEGGIGANVYKDGDEAIFKELEKTGIVKFFKNAEDALSALSEISEQSTRTKVFEKALRSGLDTDVAALVSRDATIDFAKMGTVMQTLNQAIPFLNARVQGFSNLGRVIKNDPEMFMRTQMLTSAYPAIALHKWNNQWDSYANISQEIKDKYWVIVHNEVETIDMNTGEKILIPQFITIPKAEGQVLAANPIQYYLERASVKDPRGVMEMIVDTIGSASPVEFQRFTHNNPLITAVSQFGPTGTLLAGGISGKDPFFGTDLVPINKQGETVENYLKYKTSTPEYLKNISKIFANPDENGKSRGVNMSPAYLDFIINSAGGIPQVLSNITDLIYSAASGKDLSSKKTDTAFGTATQMPISRRIFREASPYYSPEAEGEKKYTKEVEKDAKTQSILSKEKIDSAAKDYLKAYNDKESFPDNESLIDYYNNYILGSYNMSDEERKSFVKEVNERIIGIASGSIGQINVNQSVDVRATLLLKKYWDILDSEGEEKAQAFWKEAQDKKILTKDVMRRINELQEDR
jgi:hypothetical protein